MIRQRANRPTVRPSVTLLKYRSHIGWNTSKIVSRLIRLRSLLFFCRPNITDLPEILAIIGKQLATMHHLTCGINSLLHSVNLIVFTLLLVHLILCLSHMIDLRTFLRSHHLSLLRPFTPDLKLICFTNPFLHSHSFLPDCLHGS